MQNFNFKILKIDKISFPNELIFILKKNKIKNKKLKIKKDNIFEKNIILLKKIKKKLINYKKYKNFVLGTTVNASFVDEIIRDSVTHFVDENLSRNKKFREKKIIHPKKIINNQNVIVPYENKYAKKIILNLKKKYKGNYFKI